MSCTPGGSTAGAHLRDGDTLSSLHERLILGDAFATEEIASLLLPRLCRLLHHRFIGTAEDIVADAVEDALVRYFMCPHEFDKKRNVPLDRFLYKAAWRNVVDLLRAEARRKTRERKYAEWIAAECRLARRARSEEIIRIDRALRALLVDTDERNAIRAWINGERRTPALAAALRICDRSPLEQTREVKRFKDRVTKRLARLVHDRNAHPPQY